MSKIALLIKAIPLLSMLGDKLVVWFKKDPKIAKQKLIFVGVMAIVLAILAAIIGEPNISIGIDAVKQLCNEVDC